MFRFSGQTLARLFTTDNSARPDVFAPGRNQGSSTLNMELGLVWPLQICVTSSFLAATVCHRFNFRKRFKQNSTTTTTIKPLSHDQSRARLSSEFTERSFPTRFWIPSSSSVPNFSDCRHRGCPDCRCSHWFFETFSEGKVWPSSSPVPHPLHSAVAMLWLRCLSKSAGPLHHAWTTGIRQKQRGTAVAPKAPRGPGPSPEPLSYGSYDRMVWVDQWHRWLKWPSWSIK